VLHIDVRGRIGTLPLAISLDIGAAPLAVVGPNGAGKTSVLLLALGLLRPESGRIRLGDQVLFDDGVDVPAEDRRIGYLPQDYALFPHLTVAQNIEFALGCRGTLGRAERRQRARALLGDLEVVALADRAPATLSGGERQRVALARALAIEPRALLLDEPLAALDVGARRAVRGFLAATLARLGLPAIVVTHDAADAVALGDRIAVLEAGRIVQTGTLADLRAAPASPFVAAFAGA
jgi:molybdate transport system ATP-binding protein